MQQPTKHFLVIQLARFGDLIQTKRLLATLCARPGSQVHLCLDRSLEPLARLVYPEVVLHPITAHGTGLHGHEALRAMLTDNRCAFADLRAVSLSGSTTLIFPDLTSGWPRCSIPTGWRATPGRMARS